MKTIEAYEKDIKRQSEFLKNFKKQKTLTKPEQNNIIFTGSGDSLASALLAEAYSDFQVRAMDPLDLSKNKAIAKNNTIYFVSISGNTISNIKVAKIAKKSIAITSRANSRLANVCNESIILQAPNSDVFTAGSISFLDSALTCISLVCPISIPKRDFYKIAFLDAKKIKVGKKIFFLGNQFTFPVAMYAAAKFYEIVGYNAYYEKIEQFSHMELFSAKKGDTVIIFEEKNSHNQMLVKNLRKFGINAILQSSTFDDKISQTIYFAIFSQLLSLFEAKRLGKKDCNFVLQKRLRQVSDNMIY